VKIPTGGFNRFDMGFGNRGGDADGGFDLEKAVRDEETADALKNARSQVKGFKFPI
jgi:hypothetical protein